MITLVMACGHALSVNENGAESPICACGERRVAKVIARAPTFRGVCQGPHATYEALGGIPVKVGHESVS